MNEKVKKEKKPRDEWIAETWRYNGAGYQKNKKKTIERKKKYKKSVDFDD